MSSVAGIRLESIDPVMVTVSPEASPKSTLPVSDTFAAVTVPVAVMCRNPVISLLESTTTALLAATVPAVTSLEFALDTALSI